MAFPSRGPLPEFGVFHALDEVGGTGTRDWHVSGKSLVPVWHVSG